MRGGEHLKKIVNQKLRGDTKQMGGSTIIEGKYQFFSGTVLFKKSLGDTLIKQICKGMLSITGALRILVYRWGGLTHANFVWWF